MPSTQAPAGKSPTTSGKSIPHSAHLSARACIYIHISEVFKSQIRLSKGLPFHLVTILLLIVYAAVSSSLTPYHPTSVPAYRTIFVTSLLAIVAGLSEKVPLGTPTFVCSLLCLFGT